MNNNFKVGIIVQARMGSTRLPGKMNLPIENKPAIIHTISRLKKTSINQIVVATSINKEDDIIADLALSQGVLLFRGSENDVLDRFYQAAGKYQIDPVVRICGDGVMMDPEVVNKVYEYYRGNNFDYVSNNKPPSFPNGYEVEVFSFVALKEAWEKSSLAQQREHVTPYIWMHDNKFKIGNYLFKEDVSKFKCALNNESDYKFIKAVFKELFSSNNLFTLPEVLALLRIKPQLSDINIISINDSEQIMAKIKSE